VNRLAGELGHDLAALIPSQLTAHGAGDTLAR
jgi:hypothetical protein